MKRKKSKISSKITLLIFAILIAAIIYGYTTQVDINFFRNAEEPSHEILPEVPVIRETPSLEEVSVSFIDVGQGDATLIRTENFVLLIDTGSRTAEEQVLRTLRDKEIETIDLIILTHGHEDHIGNARSIMEAFEVLEVKYPQATHELVETLVWGRTLDAIEEHNVSVIYPIVGQNRYFDDVRIDILGPLEGLRGINNNSIMLRVTHGEVSFMFSGDAEREAERAAVATGNITPVNVILAGHHGSNTSSTDEWLDATSPRYAIISAGENNRHNHPHSLVLYRLETRNINIKKTKELGTITALSDGYNLRFVLQNNH